jgi:serine/threonine protein kinase
MSEIRLDRLIGGGAFGQVYRGTWMGTAVAVKILTSLSIPIQTTPTPTPNPTPGGAIMPVVPDAVLRAFEAEVDVFARLRHPNICLFLGACLSAPTRAIVTELVARGSLWEALRTPGLFEVSMDVYIYAYMYACMHIMYK